MEKIDLFCGINSVGMPFPRENKQHIGYFDIVRNNLTEDGYDVNGINISSLNMNRTQDLEKILNSDYSLAKIRNIQVCSIDALRNANFLFKLVIPKNFKERYKPTPEDENITFKDVLTRSENPVFIYSAGPNDFFDFIHAGPVELMNEEVRKKLPSNLEQLVELAVHNAEKNWQLLHQLNDRINIPALSFYYSPLYDKIQKVIHLQEKRKDKNTLYENHFNRIITLYNSLLQESANKYDYVDYLDITFLKDYCSPMDFHPNTLGNQLIAQKVMTSLNDKKISQCHTHK